MFIRDLIKHGGEILTTTVLVSMEENYINIKKNVMEIKPRKDADKIKFEEESTLYYSFNFINRYRHLRNPLFTLVNKLDVGD